MDLTEVVAAEGRWIATESPIDIESRKANYREGFEREDSMSFVADAAGAIVGNAGIGTPSSAVPPRLGMMVAPEWRGGGIGTALLQACVDWARARGAHKVQLEVWPHNSAAIALYEKHGFVQEAYLVKHYRRKNGELWDSISMGLLL
jgi:RimJ/RimL family protein N-acetyltransferase